MARLNVYVPDELADEARAAELNVSSLTQDAIRAALAARSTDEWLAARHAAPPHAPPPRRVTHESVLDALDATRDEAPTRHG